MKKTAIFIMIVGIIVATIVLFKVINDKKNETQIVSVPTDISEDKAWAGSFQLAWNELIELIGTKIEFTDTESTLADELNKQQFTKDMINDKDYYCFVSNDFNDLENRINKDLLTKFNIQTQLPVFEAEQNGFIIYTMLYKDVKFAEKFERLEDNYFANSSNKVRYFGALQGEEYNKMKSNAEVLYYNPLENDSEFAVKLKTTGNDEIILFRTDEEGDFSELYRKLNYKMQINEESKTLSVNDKLIIPYINMNKVIEYNELCGHPIKGDNPYSIIQAYQNIIFKLDEVGASLNAEANITGIMSTPREFNFNNRFVVFMKESDKQTPYFALLVDDLSTLVEAE